MLVPALPAGECGLTTTGTAGRDGRPAADMSQPWRYFSVGQEPDIPGVAFQLADTRAAARLIPSARLDDNPYLRHTAYRARVMALPEPLRSKLLKGDFLAGRQDAEFQVIPSAWIAAAQERWHLRPGPMGASRVGATSMRAAWPLTG